MVKEGRYNSPIKCLGIYTFKFASADLVLRNPTQNCGLFMIGWSSEGMNCISIFPEKGWGQKACFCDHPKVVQAFLCPPMKGRSDLFLGPKTTPGAQHTRWDLLFERTFRGGHYTTNPNSARFFSGEIPPKYIFWHQVFDSSLKKGWHFMIPRVSQTGSSKCWKT